MLTSKDYIGGVPVVVRLAESDVLRPTDRPAPAAFVLPRTTLLLAIVRDVLQLFAPYATALHPDSTQVWFSACDVPISWVYPVGAVKDYMNELLREQQTAGLLRVVAERAEEFTVGPTASSSSASPSRAVAAGTALSQAFLSALMSAPLELDFHIHPVTRDGALLRVVPQHVRFDRLDDYLRMEIKQLHKASYTCLYGDYKTYQRETEASLQSAIGLALYRPFDAGQPVITGVSDTMQYSNALAPGPSGVPSSYRLNPPAPASTTLYTSPYLMTEYQQLLRGIRSSRPRASYLLRIGFPYAYRSSSRGSGPNAEAGSFQYVPHRVAAAPALPVSPLAASETEVVEVGADQLCLGVLLWRLFLVPCLRWQKEQTAMSAGAAPDATPTSEARSAFDALFSSLSPYYADPPAVVLEALDDQDALLFAGPTERLPWRAWEADGVKRLISQYDDPSGCCGLPFQVPPTAGVSQTGKGVVDPDGRSVKRRLLFCVQGTQPSLLTMASFLEMYLSSSDRATFVTLQVH